MLFPNFDDLAIDLIDKLLKFNPKNRLVDIDALQHPYSHTETLICEDRKLTQIEIEMDKLMVKMQRKKDR